jgi:hypothetical protein
MKFSRNSKIILVLVGLLILAAVIKFAGLFQKPATEADATNFVIDDLRSKYPNADLQIMNIANKTNVDGGNYFEVKARVTQNADSSCPERSHIFYNYPIQNFVPQTPEIITQNCRVCTEGICTIAFREEAIIASHTFNGTSEIGSFLSLNPNARPNIREGNDSWTVDWFSNTSDYGFEVVLHRSGRVLNVQRVPATQN